MQPVTHYFLGFDLGKDRDHSAIAVMAYKQIEDGGFDAVTYSQPMRPVLDLVTMLRIPLGVEYLEVIRRLRKVVTKIQASSGWGQPQPRVHLVIDSAGPGQVAVELIRRQQLGINIVATLLSGGTESNFMKSGKVTIPRRDLLSNARYLLESETLRIAEGLKFGKVLEKEFAAIRPTGGQKEHDDLAIATGLAAWHATKVLPNLLRRRRA